MKQDKIHDALNLLDDEMIEEVDRLRNGRKKSKYAWVRWLSVAACFCVIFGGIYAMKNAEEEKGNKTQTENSAGTVCEEEKPNGTKMTYGENIQLKPEEILADFAVKLFRESEENGENTLISPLSVMYALAMVENGAKEETLAQMESALGLSAEELQSYLSAYFSELSAGAESELKLANSIWFRDDGRLTLNKAFLQMNEEYYNAGVFCKPFDTSTLEEINAWVEERTDGMIPEILNKIPEEAMMYLINALAFEAEWENPYEERQVAEGTFTTEDGAKQQVEFLYDNESTYLEAEDVKGFLKYYKGCKYAFLALLPNEGVSISDYVSKLDGTYLIELIENADSASVETSIPKFEAEYTIRMKELLKNMGMEDAFDMEKADLSGIGTMTDGTNICINEILHKTHISVNEKGTKAGAVTSVELYGGTTAVSERKEVYLDRPFVYMLIDCETNIPLFIGTMMSVNK